MQLQSKAASTEIFVAASERKKRKPTTYTGIYEIFAECRTNAARARRRRYLHRRAPNYPSARGADNAARSSSRGEPMTVVENEMHFLMHVVVVVFANVHKAIEYQQQQPRRERAILSRGRERVERRDRECALSLSRAAHTSLAVSPGRI